MTAKKLIQSEFKDYMDHVFPGLSPSSDQYKDIKRSFCCGMMSYRKVLYDLIKAAGNDEEKESVIDDDITEAILLFLKGCTIPTVTIQIVKIAKDPSVN
jgi:hypothetical protein